MTRINWRLNSSLLLLITLPILALSQNDSTSIKSFTIGKSVEFYSSELGENRIINVYLPASYHPDSTQKYNVIYLLDG
jgi:enterochelin esterase-like enzyme